MNKKFGDEISAILNTIIERCKKEKDNGCLLVPLDDYYERVSYYTAYPKIFIEEVTGVAIVTPVDKKHFDLYSHLLLMECMITLITNTSMPPTLSNLYIMFRDKKNSDMTTSSFCLQANEVKYEFRKTTEGSVILMENPKITFERFNYFTKMENYRSQDKTIYYIDETCIDANLRVRKPSLNRQSEDEQILFLMMSSDGYENGLFTNQANEEVYKNWIENLVLPLLKLQSIIVMTTSYLHGDKLNEITRYHSKMQMMKWLRDKGIPYSEDMRKAELYDLIDKCTIKTRQITIDTLLKCHGHQVIHLPSTFEEISPISFMWEHIQQQSALLSNENVYIASNKIHSYITNLGLSTWKSFLKKSEQYEVKIANLDKQIETNFDSLWKLDEKYELDASCVCPFHHSFVAEGRLNKIFD